VSEGLGIDGREGGATDKAWKGTGTSDWFLFVGEGECGGAGEKGTAVVIHCVKCV